uniref:Uncharacterized protein n=1 Tax=Oryza brachyantha TaxID=4533 RepID=J3LU19_ORYBR
MQKLRHIFSAEKSGIFPFNSLRRSSCKIMSQTHTCSCFTVQLSSVSSSLFTTATIP